MIWLQEIMFFSIDPQNGVPLFDQIVRQVKYAIAESTVVPGELLPSVRQLSQQLTLNPNTVARAYQQLQAEGLIEPLRGRGLVVATGAAKKCRSDRRVLIATRIESVVAEAIHAGLTSDEILQLVRHSLKSMDGQLPTISSDPNGEE